MLARNRDFGPFNLSRVTRQSGNTNPREKMMSRSRDIRDEKGFILLTRMEALLRNRLRRLARRSNFGPGHLSRASRRSQRTNPLPKRQWLCRDIRESWGRACWAEQDAHIRNRHLRLARRSILAVSSLRAIPVPLDLYDVWNRLIDGRARFDHC